MTYDGNISLHSDKILLHVMIDIKYALLFKKTTRTKDFVVIDLNETQYEGIFRMIYGRFDILELSLTQNSLRNPVWLIQMANNIL